MKILQAVIGVVTINNNLTGAQSLRKKAYLH